MKEKLFIDADIILDIAFTREPLFRYSSLILSSIESKLVEGFTSSVVISNIYYVIKKIESHKTAIDFIAKLGLLIKVLPVTDEIIQLSLESYFKDFEDALQYYTSIINKIDFLITRNVKDYTRTEMKVHTPEEYLKLKNIQKNVGTDG